MNRSIQPALAWKPAADTEYGDIRYEVAEGIAKLTICRPEVRNAFRPRTLFELQDAVERARSDPTIGVIVLTGEGAQAFCSGGDQRIRGDDGYVGDDGIGRLNVLDLQVQIRRLPKPVVAMVAGYAIGGGHVLHVVCDLTIAADNARFGQTGPKVVSSLTGSRSVPDMTTAAEWFSGARPRTLGAALSPVLVGAAAAYADADTVIWWRAVAALVVALALQVGVNYANDYSDGVRGTDAHRGLGGPGPLRLVGSGVAAPGAVKRAAFACFGVAAVAGLVLALLTTLWLVVLGAVM